MNKTFRTFSAFGWDFEVVFPHSDEENQWVKEISRPDDRGTGSILVEEASPLWEELHSALLLHPGWNPFVLDTYEEIKNDFYDSYDDYGDDFYDDAGDALSSRDDEMGQ